MKQLVTGAGGFIGRHLALELAAAGEQVVALDLHADRLPPASGTLEPLVGDVADPACRERALQGVDTVFHLAAAHLSVAADEAEFRRVNVEATAGLVDDALRCGVRRFVHCSSVGVFGTIDDPPADEETPCRPEIAYERTKLEGEQVVLAAHRERGLPLVVLRPVWVYGPGCARTEKLLRTIGRGKFVVGGKGDGLRHCIYIADMLRAFRLAAASEKALGQVIIVGDREPVTVRQLVDTIAQLTGAAPPRSVPLGLLYAAGLAAELLCKPLGKEPPLSRRTLKFFTGNTAFRTDRARELLGFAAEFDLAAGLRATRAALEQN